MRIAPSQTRVLLTDPLRARGPDRAGLGWAAGGLIGAGLAAWAYPSFWVRDLLAILPMAALGLLIFIFWRMPKPVFPAGRARKPVALMVFSVIAAGIAALPLDLGRSFELHLIDWQRPLLVFGLCGLVVLVAGARMFGVRPPRSPLRWKELTLPLVIGLAAGAYGCSLFALLDVQLDRASPRLSTPLVQAARVDRMKYGRRYLITADFGAGRPDEAEVSGDVYRRLHLGARACVRLHPGALGARWREIAACGEG